MVNKYYHTLFILSLDRKLLFSDLLCVSCVSNNGSMHPASVQSMPGFEKLKNNMTCLRSVGHVSESA